MVNQLNAGQTFGNLTNQLQANQTNIGQARANAASMQMQNLINAALAGGQLATTTQNLGLGDVNALSTLGGQQQQIAQNQQLFPLQLAAQQSNILRGYTIPTSVSGGYSGPIPGAYGTSPLGAGLGTASLIGALTQRGSSGTSPLDNIMSLFGPSAATKAGQEASRLYGAGNVYGPGGGGVVPATFDPNLDSLFGGG